MKFIKMSDVTAHAAYCFGCTDQCNNRCYDQGIGQTKHAATKAVQNVESLQAMSLQVK